VGFFYTEGTELAEVTENGEAVDNRSANFGATKGTSGRVAAALSRRWIFLAQRVPHIVAEVKTIRTYHLVV